MPKGTILKFHNAALEDFWPSPSPGQHFCTVQLLPWHKIKANTSLRPFKTFKKFHHRIQQDLCTRSGLSHFSNVWANSFNSEWHSTSLTRAIRRAFCLPTSLPSFFYRFYKQPLRLNVYCISVKFWDKTFPI
jgi:hypothetical protein